VHEILVDGGELFLQRLVQLRDDIRIPSHEPSFFEIPVAQTLAALKRCATF
jgi:hypothetical protein